MKTKGCFTIILIGIILCVHLPVIYAQGQPLINLRHRPDNVLCGPQSLLSICQRMSVEAELNELKTLSGFDEKKGTTMLGLMKAVEAKGLHAVGMKIGVNDLAKLEIPSIAHLRSNHFVVVENGGKPNELEVTDPPHEPMTVTTEDFATVYSGFALLISKDKSLFPEPDFKGPDLRVDAYSYDFGFIEEGEQVGHVYTLENRGDEELVISKVEAACGHAEVFFTEEKRIPPGGKDRLVVGFNGAGRQGTEYQTIYVHSNDLITPIVQLEFTGVVKPVMVLVSQRSLTFGTVKKRKGAERNIYVSDPGDGSLIIEEAVSDSPFVQTALAQRHDGTRYLVAATLTSDAPVGELKSKITLHTNHPREPVVEIPVEALVVGDVEVFPDMFFLGLVKKGQSASKTITVSTTADEPLQIEEVVAPFDFAEITVRPEIEASKYSLTAVLKDSAPTGLLKGDVIIHTNNPDQPRIGIPLYALVEE